MVILIHACLLRSTARANPCSARGAPLAGIQTHAAPSHAGGFASGTLPARRWLPANCPSVLPVPLRARPFEADLCQEGRTGCGAAALRRLPHLPAEFEAVAAGHRSPATAVEAVAAGPIPIKHFCRSLSISLDIRPPVCHK